MTHSHIMFMITYMFMITCMFIITPCPHLGCHLYIITSCPHLNCHFLETRTNKNKMETNNHVLETRTNSEIILWNRMEGIFEVPWPGRSHRETWPSFSNGNRVGRSVPSPSMETLGILSGGKSTPKCLRMNLINELFPVPESPSMATFTKGSRAASACASSLTLLT